MYFPTICVDNFFNDPEKVRQFALSLPYNACKDASGIWPGIRTRPLHEINYDFFLLFTRKFFKMFYDLTVDVPPKWLVEVMFQKFPKNQYGNIRKGWVHHDHTPGAGVIYLNPGVDSSCGTSLYKQKENTFFASMTPELLELKNEQHLNFNPQKESIYQDAIEKHNLQFVETVRFSNVYNRLIAYDGNTLHGVEDFYGTNDEERLIMVFFIKGVMYSKHPIPEMRTVDL
jgi:hypothetical protein